MANLLPLFVTWKNVKTTQTIVQFKQVTDNKLCHHEAFFCHTTDERGHTTKKRSTFMNRFTFFSDVLKSRLWEGKKRNRKRVKKALSKPKMKITEWRVLVVSFFAFLSQRVVYTFYDICSPFLYRFNRIWPRNGTCNNPKCDSIRTECNNDMWIWAWRWRSLFGEMV